MNKYLPGTILKCNGKKAKIISVGYDFKLRKVIYRIQVEGQIDPISIDQEIMEKN